MQIIGQIPLTKITKITTVHDSKNEALNFTIEIKRDFHNMQGTTTTVRQPYCPKFPKISLQEMYYLILIPTPTTDLASNKDSTIYLKRLLFGNKNKIQATVDAVVSEDCEKFNVYLKVDSYVGLDIQTETSPFKENKKGGRRACIFK